MIFKTTKSQKEISTMTAPDSLPLHALTEENLASASPDFLRTMIKTFADSLMSAEADALCGAEYGQVSDERVHHRNGYRPREWDTRADTVELAIPPLRKDSYFPPGCWSGAAGPSSAPADNVIHAAQGPVRSYGRMSARAASSRLPDRH
jgi:hypothetical protein